MCPFCDMIKCVYVHCVFIGVCIDSIDYVNVCDTVFSVAQQLLNNQLWDECRGSQGSMMKGYHGLINHPKFVTIMHSMTLYMLVYIILKHHLYHINLLEVGSSWQSVIMDKSPLNVHQLVIDDPYHILVAIHIYLCHYLLYNSMEINTCLSELIHCTFDVFCIKTRKTYKLRVYLTCSTSL